MASEARSRFCAMAVNSDKREWVVARRAVALRGVDFFSLIQLHVATTRRSRAQCECELYAGGVEGENSV